MTSLKQKIFACVSSIVLFFNCIDAALYADTDSTQEESFASSNDVFSLRAHVKDLFAWMRTDSYSETLKEKDLLANLTRVRLSPELNFEDSLTFHLDFDNEVIAGNYLRSREFNVYWRDPYENYNDFFHASHEVKYTEDYLYRAKIHRAYAKAILGDFTFSVGRQQFRFGSGRLWNPLDVLNPINPLNFEGASEQKGIDGASAEYFINDKTVITAVLCPQRSNDDFSESFSTSNVKVIGRLKTNISFAEISLLAGKLPEREAYGGDISLILFGGTLRGSALFTREEIIEHTIIANGGFEYTFSFGLYFLLEYFYNRASLNAEPKLLAAYVSSLSYSFDDAAFRLLANRFLTFNRHYAALALGYDITPLWRAELFTIYDYEGEYILINPSIQYNLYQDIDLSCAVMYAWKAKQTSKSSELSFVEKHPLVYAMMTWFFL